MKTFTLMFNPFHYTRSLHKRQNEECSLNAAEGQWDSIYFYYAAVSWLILYKVRLNKLDCRTSGFCFSFIKTQRVLIFVKWQIFLLQKDHFTLKNPQIGDKVNFFFLLCHTVGWRTLLLVWFVSWKSQCLRILVMLCCKQLNCFYSPRT